MRPKFFYGYVILGLCFINMVVMRGVNGAFGVYYLALLEEFGWSRSDGASIASINFVVYALAAPVVGFAFDRLGPRLLMPLGAALVGLGFLLSSFSTSLLHLHFSYGVVTALGQGALGFVGHNALISFWFVRQRATAIGIASMGQGLGALVMVPATQMLISSIGWRWTYIVTGSLLLFLLVPANAFFQRRAPQDVGQFPDGEEAPAPLQVARQAASRQAQRDWALGEAARSLPFWYITIGHLALGTALFLINTHVIAHFVAVGYEKLAASFYFGLIGFIRIGATIFWGSISDRLGRSTAYGIAILVTGLGVGGMIAMTVGAPLWLVYLTIALYGVGHSAGNPTYGAVIGDIFAGRRIGLIFGFLEISFGLGSAFGSWIGGYLFDTTGSYAWSFTLCLVCFAISGLAIHTCARWQARETGRALTAEETLA
ncbi:MAG TPA: MFS transporter [Candidatus Limnocylindrales bacterium]|nr:MFS transporter [Candidatus Limnocylindrales bacterium]